MGKGVLEGSRSQPISSLQKSAPRRPRRAHEDREEKPLELGGFIFIANAIPCGPVMLLLMSPLELRVLLRKSEGRLKAGGSRNHERTKTRQRNGRESRVFVLSCFRDLFSEESPFSSYVGERSS
jgi:hypothetical protein